MEQGRRIATNMRALRILEAVSNSSEPLTPTEISRIIDLPKQTIHRVCHSLVDQNFLTRNPETRQLRPARRLRELASNVSRASHMHIARHQILQRVAKSIRETVNFVMPEEDGMHYVDRVETDWPFRVQLPVGSNVPFHCTASGKTYLASLSTKGRRAFVEAMELSAQTPRTLDRPDALLTELQRVSDQGYATDTEEFMEGMVAIAVPVHDSTGRYAASLAFHGPTVRLTIEDAIERKDILLDAARELRTVLFEND